MTINIKQIAICIILGAIFAIPATILTTYIEWEYVSKFSSLMAEYQLSNHPSSFLRHPLLRLLITWLVCNVFIFKIYEYFANFDPNNAFKDILVPLGILFLAFNWLDVLRWH